MKQKNFFSLASVAAMLASLAATPVSAAHINAYSVSYETLTEAIETANGETIPAGTIAVTMSVNGNTGFNANTLTLHVKDGYTVVTDQQGEPVVEKGSILEDAMIGKAVNGNAVGVTMALAESTTENGDLFTVYFTANANASADVKFVQLEQPEIAVESVASLKDGGIGTNSVIVGSALYFYGGDCNNDNIINAVDASLILQAMKKTDYKDLNINTTNFIANYFPSVVKENQPDANGDGYITHRDKDNDEYISEQESDSQTILTYAAYQGVGATYTGYGYKTVGQKIRAL